MVVVSHRPGPWLDACLSSVADQADQVVVVDNGSADGEAGEVAARHGMQVVRSATNTGFTGGVAQGLARVRGDVVALLNDDAVAGATWLAESAAVLADPSVAAVAPKVLMAGWYREVVLHDEGWSAGGDERVLGRQVRSVTAGGEERLGGVGGAGIHRVESSADGDRWRWTAGAVPFVVPVGERPDATVEVDGAAVDAGPALRVLNSAGTYLRSDGYAGDHGLMAPDTARFDRPRECFAASGVALVTTAAVLARVGGLAGGYFAYYEDVDWSWRARLAGLQVRYVPAARVEHRRGATSGGESEEWVRRLAERNRSITLARNAPWAVAVAHLRQRVLHDAEAQLRADVARRVPAALAHRARARPRWRLRPAAVWERWAGADTTWNTWD